MLKLLVTAGILFCIVSLASCQECRCERYFYWTGSASNAWDEGKTSEAVKRYRYALKETCFPFGVDLDRALGVAIHDRDSSLAMAIAIQLARGGVPQIYFDKVQLGQWLPRFTEEFAKSQEVYEQAFNLEMRCEFLAVIVMDSIFNSQYHQWRTGSMEISKDDLISGAKAISDRFIALVRKFGFPCEEKMGYYSVNGQIMSFPILPLLMHIYQRGELLYHDHLYHIVCDGKLRLTDQAVLDHCRGFTDGGGVDEEMEARYRKYGSSRN